ncbi:MAG TPA: alpha-L-rhamnosidase N-terminal domain-containing protein [Chryseolinea sp.]|nr:alpha-L-rhamnosidase N-terminal domain-containing protein [Chryseolinea sp.]
MFKILLSIFIAAVFLECSPLVGQTISAELLQKPWKAQWITGPGMLNGWNVGSDPALKEYGIFKFRKTIELSDKPTSFVIHVSADNRYKLFVNGKHVSQGPARGDLYFWNFETVDIASYLNAGSNTVAAVVWNDGKRKPEAQISYLTGFILQGNTTKEEVLNTNDSWKTIKDESYTPLSVRATGYYVAGPGELVDMNKQIGGWDKAKFDDSQWVKARVIAPGLPKNAAINSTGWMLVPSPIPPMEMTVQRLLSTRKAEGIQVPASFPATKTQVTIPANTKTTILLDQGYLTNAYPTIIFSGGRNASISMAYAEGLYIRKNENLHGPWIPELPKGNRNEIDGKTFIGKADSLISNGSANQEYSPLWWRTYRYIRLVVSTKAEPLVIEDLYGTFTGYPFQQNAKLQTQNTEINKMLEIGWRTARLCAYETYMDCPYYEQLQYIGDARIQMLVSFYNAGDDRLARNGLTLMDHSRLAEGITQSRYPTDLNQEIPTFSLWWIAMLHDYYMYRPDSIFIKDKLPGARQVLSFFERYQQADGSLKNVPYWVFTDWVEHKGWNFGMAPKGSNGESAILDMQLLWVYQLAAELEEHLGLKDFDRLYTVRAEQLKQTIQKKYWDSNRKLYADTEAKDFFSQHVNSLAILSGVIVGENATTLAKTMLSDTTLAPASIYFKYYLHQALIKAGLGDDYLKWLDKWRENMSMGLSTWAESSDVSTARSDCHAWGSSPNIEFFRTVLGIDSDAPGFSKIKISPHLGAIEEISGEMPHPNGRISVKYKLQKGGLRAEINLPAKTNGTFVWKGKSYALKAGPNTFTL